MGAIILFLSFATGSRVIEWHGVCGRRKALQLVLVLVVLAASRPHLLVRTSDSV